jgi:thioredoxin-related protein
MKTSFCTALALTLAALTLHADNSSWEKLQAEARAQKKLVFMNFTGSDWCPRCIQFQREVESSAYFQAYAKSNLVIAKVDFPRFYPQSPEQHDANVNLAVQFKILNPDGSVGFPIFLLTDADGKDIGRWQGYPPGLGPTNFVAALEAARTNAAAKSPAIATPK